MKQIAGVWQSFYPAHVVPHIYPRTGPVSVTLTVFDTAGASNTLTRLGDGQRPVQDMGAAVQPEQRRLHDV